MDRNTYALLEQYMLSCTADSAHDAQHVYRVLYHGLEIARTEPDVDMDVLIAACLLHDIGRPEQFADPALCHAEVGAEKACRFLTEQGFAPDFAERVRHCVLTHRFRKNRPPESPEAKILFDADKLDVTGAMGVARTLVYQGTMAQPLYSLGADGSVSDGDGDGTPSFFQEYHRKLKRVYDRFYTARGAELAAESRAACDGFYHRLLEEVRGPHDRGRAALEDLLD